MGKYLKSTYKQRANHSTLLWTEYTPLYSIFSHINCAAQFAWEHKWTLTQCVTHLAHPMTFHSLINYSGNIQTWWIQSTTIFTGFYETTRHMLPEKVIVVMYKDEHLHSVLSHIDHFVPLNCRWCISMDHCIIFRFSNKYVNSELH